MVFYKCRLIDDSYNIKEKLLYATSKSDLLSQNSNIIKYRKYNIRINTSVFVSQFFKIMQQLISNQYNVVQALSITANCFTNETYKLIVLCILDKIKQGVLFSEALAQFNNFFEKSIIEILRVSEMTGRLNESIKNVIQYLDYNMSFNKKVRDALRYPTLVLILMFIIAIIWIMWIIPQLSKTFDDLGLPIPTATRCLLAVNNFINNHYLIALSFPIILLYLCKLLRIRVPIISKFRTAISKFQFLENMSLMLREQVHLIDALRCITNRLEFKKYSGLINEISEGHGLANSIGIVDFLTEQDISVLSISERTGQYWVAFKTLSDITRITIENNLIKITKRLPTILICIVGLLLLIFVYGTFIPLYSSIDTAVCCPI